MKPEETIRRQLEIATEKLESATEREEQAEHQGEIDALTWVLKNDASEHDVELSLDEARDRETSDRFEEARAAGEIGTLSWVLS